jgi:hypothetical protein
MALQRVERTDQYITRAELPTIHDIYIRGCGRKARKIVKDYNHPSHRLFSVQEPVGATPDVPVLLALRKQF